MKLSLALMAALLLSTVALPGLSSAATDPYHPKPHKVKRHKGKKHRMS